MIGAAEQIDAFTPEIDGTPRRTGGAFSFLDIAKTSDVTMLCVTHAMTFARDVSHRVLLFDEGEIVEDGTPEQIFDIPATTGSCAR
jgi:polar amino acid transport system ATP-binding protein